MFVDSDRERFSGFECTRGSRKHHAATEPSKRSHPRQSCLLALRATALLITAPALARRPTDGRHHPTSRRPCRQRNQQQAAQTPIRSTRSNHGRSDVPSPKQEHIIVTGTRIRSAGVHQPTRSPRHRSSGVPSSRAEPDCQGFRVLRRSRRASTLIQLWLSNLSPTAPWRRRRSPSATSALTVPWCF